MIHLKTYKQLLESLTDKMSPKSDDDIELALSKLDIYNKLIKIKQEGLDDKYKPSDKDIKEYLSELDVEEHITTIKELGLDDKFLPSDDEIKKHLSELDLEDWLYQVQYLDLDSEFNPPSEKILEYILPSNITYNSENGTLEFSEWSDFTELFEEDRDVRDGYIENVLSGMGREYFEYYDTIEPDYFSFSDDKLFQDVKTEIKEKINELDPTEDEYEEMVNDFNSATSFNGLYKVLKEYDILDEIKTAVEWGYTSAQELADESEAYDSLMRNITDTFHGGEVTYENDKYIMPITIPDFDLDEIVDNGRIIEWAIPYNGWYGDVDDDTFREELLNRLYDV